jgi:hypothetical protein
MAITGLMPEITFDHDRERAMWEFFNDREIARVGLDAAFAIDSAFVHGKPAVDGEAPWKLDLALKRLADCATAARELAMTSPAFDFIGTLLPFDQGGLPSYLAHLEELGLSFNPFRSAETRQRYQENPALGRFLLAGDVANTLNAKRDHLLLVLVYPERVLLNDRYREGVGKLCIWFSRFTECPGKFDSGIPGWHLT